jgi:hypothetical protein
MRLASLQNGLSLLAVCVLGVISCRSQDPIDRLVNKISSTDPESRNSHFGPVDLPATASVQEVVKNTMGRVKVRKFITIRDVHIKQATRPFTAVLIDSVDEGQKIVLLFYMGERGWWTQVYDPN